MRRERVMFIIRELYNTAWCIRKGFPLRMALCHVWFKDIPESTTFAHPYGITIRVGTQVGEDCTFASNVTIGQKRGEQEFATIGNRVFFGAGSVVLGAVNIGDDTWIGAGSVVTKSFPAKSVLIGNPAKAI